MAERLTEKQKRMLDMYIATHKDKIDIDWKPNELPPEAIAYLERVGDLSGRAFDMITRYVKKKAFNGTNRGIFGRPTNESPQDKKRIWNIVEEEYSD